MSIRVVARDHLILVRDFKAPKREGTTTAIVAVMPFPNGNAQISDLHAFPSALSASHTSDKLH